MFRIFTTLAFPSLSSLCALAQTVDIVGNSSNVAVTTNVAKGNSYEITTSVVLTQAEFNLTFSGPQTLIFTVHESPVEFGTYSEVFRTSALVNGIGTSWYSSGAINVPLNAGSHYIVAVSWNGVMTYYFDVADFQTVSFGQQTHGYAIGLNPLPTQFSSSVNDGAIYYQRLTTSPPGPVITPFCTSGTTTHGCVPSIAGTGVPSATAGSGFTLSVTNVEGQKSGILFYGIDNSAFTPMAWGTSSSFLCVKPPTQRSLPQSSGGTINQCDGALSLDWNAFIASNPSALGVPFSAGDSVYAQGWFRDPPNPKHTMLSNALLFTVGP